MARPRIFISSTYYDLKHIRSSLELFIESLGFEPVLSERGDIPYLPDVALDESCYREAASADVFVLVIGGRYGSEISAGDPKSRKKFFDQYDSITRKEFETAYDADIPVFVLIESGVHAEYQTYLKNRDNEKVKYAHVDSANVFRLIEYVLSKQRNNPICHFERSSQIESWLRDQWAGLFRELLRARSQQKQLLALTGQVGELKAVNETLKTYLEAVLSRVTPETSEKVIQDQEKRLEEAKRSEVVKSNRWFLHLKSTLDVSDAEAERLIAEPTSAEQVFTLLRGHLKPGESVFSDASRTLIEFPEARRDFNEARKMLGLRELDFSDTIGPEALPESRRKKRTGTAAKAGAKAE